MRSCIQVSDEGTDAVATSIPAALILAIATTAVSVKTDLERLWGLSLVQFLFSVIFSQLLYSLVSVYTFMKAYVLLVEKGYSRPPWVLIVACYWG